MRQPGNLNDMTPSEELPIIIQLDCTTTPTPRLHVTTLVTHLFQHNTNRTPRQLLPVIVPTTATEPNFRRHPLLSDKISVVVPELQPLLVGQASDMQLRVKLTRDKRGPERSLRQQDDIDDPLFCQDVFAIKNNWKMTSTHHHNCRIIRRSMLRSY